MNFFAKFIATGFGSGLTPFAPGTFGSLAAMFIAYLATLTSFPFNSFLIINIFIFSILGFWATNTLESEWGKDPGKIVVDEFVGLWIAYLFITPTLTNLIIGFLLFRLFDITKILGINNLEKLPSAWGVMADDVLAGIYSNVCLQLLVLYILR